MLSDTTSLGTEADRQQLHSISTIIYKTNFCNRASHLSLLHAMSQSVVNRKRCSGTCLKHDQAQKQVPLLQFRPYSLFSIVSRALLLNPKIWNDRVKR